MQVSMSVNDQHKAGGHGNMTKFMLSSESVLRPGTLYPRLLRDLPEGETVLVAVSGGADSMALLTLLLPPEPERDRLVVGHVHHGTGEFADEAEQLVGDACTGLGIAFVCEHIQIDPKRRKQVGFEAAAREVRYESLEGIARKHNSAYLLAAHTRDDLVENFLIMSMRGAGLTGLAGLKPTRGLLRRPLLQRTREELREFVEREGVPFIDDPANDDPQYTRVIVRQQIIPQIRASFSESSIKNIARSVLHVQEADDCLDSQVTNAMETVVTRRTPGWASIDAVELRGYLDELIIRVLRRVLAQVRDCDHHDVYIDRKDRRRLLELVYKSHPGQTKEVAGVTVTDRGELEFTVYTADNQITCELPGELSFPDGSRVSIQAGSVNLSDGLSVQGSNNPGYFERLDAKLIGDSVTFRPWKSGDSFHPIGSGSGKVRVARRLRRASRERIGPLWVMETSDGHIAWVLGERIADPYKLTDQSHDIWTFRYDPPMNLQGG
jgi:tRNA(Ile)-lysidine synthase